MNYLFLCAFMFGCASFHALMHAGSCVAEEGIRSPLSEITGSYKLFVGFWELNPGPFDVQPVILLSATSPASELFHI